MNAPSANKRTRVMIVGECAAGAIALSAAVLAFASADPPRPSVAGMPVPSPSNRSAASPDPTPQAWRLSNPSPTVVPEARANPAAVPDKFAARMRSMDARARLRAFEGAPPVIPHTTADMNLSTCRACHATGLQAGDMVARMASHTYLTNCTQCHVEAESQLLDGEWAALNTFVGLRPSAYGGTRAWAGAPPVMPHATFMRTNCVSCHGEHGYDGWRPDHLSRTNCVQCHAPAAEFDQLAPTFNVPDVPDGVRPLPGS